MKCITCKCIDLKTFPSHAKVGMGRCKLEKMGGVFESLIYDRVCKDHQPADDGIVSVRVDWLEKRAVKQQ